MVLVPTERTTQMTSTMKPRRMARPTKVIAGEGAGTPTVGATDGSLAKPPRPSKQSLVLDLLRQDGGVPLAAIVDATGWLPHTARAALTGLRKKGHAIVRNKVDGVTRYSIAVGAAE